jgi:hypothetical protein
MPVKLTIPLGCQDAWGSVEYTVAGLDDLEAIHLELNGLIHRLCNLERAPHTEPDPARANRANYWSARALAAETSAKNWEENARRSQTNADYYRGLVVRIGNMLGLPAKTADDGTIAKDILCAKVPVLVRNALAVSETTKGEARRYRKLHTLLAQNQDIILRRGAAGDVKIKGSGFNTIGEGASLSDALDQLEPKT